MALVLITAITAVLIAVAGAVFGPSSIAFAFAVVWMPMTWLGTASRLAQPRLPAGFHRLRAFERSGRVYEVLGVRWCKAVLRRGPLARFNPDLHLPREVTPSSLAHLDQRMRDAEASHAILAVATLAVIAHALVRGWWASAVATLVFDVALNVYPVMLQRYNRARLARRFAAVLAPPPA